RVLTQASSRTWVNRIFTDGSPPPRNPMESGKYCAPCRQPALERAEHLLVSCECRSHIVITLVLQGGAVEPVETYGHFAPNSARSLTGKMGTRPLRQSPFYIPSFPCNPLKHVVLWSTMRLCRIRSHTQEEA